MSVRVGLGHDPVVLTCHVEADNLYWIINGSILGQYIDLFQIKGIMVNVPSFNGDMIQENQWSYVRHRLITSLCESAGLGKDKVSSKHR